MLVWYVAALAIGKEILLPTPHKAFAQLVQFLTSENFYVSVAATLLHAVASFLASLILAFALAVVASLSKTVEMLLYPFTVILRVAPTMSVIFLAIIWISSADVPYLLVFLVVFPMLYTAFLSAIKGVDVDLKQMSKVYGVQKKHVLLHLYIPSVASAVYGQIASTLSFSVKLAVAGEAVAQGSMSLGFLMQKTKVSLETGQLIAYTVVAIVLGFLLELAVKFIAYVIKKVRCKYAKAD